MQRQWAAIDFLAYSPPGPMALLWKQRCHHFIPKIGKRDLSATSRRVAHRRDWRDGVSD
jgi:hypothetical protein